MDKINTGLDCVGEYVKWSHSFCKIPFMESQNSTTVTLYTEVTPTIALVNQ